MLALFCLCCRGLLPFQQRLLSFGQNSGIDRSAQLRKDLAVAKSVFRLKRTASHDFQFREWRRTMRDVRLRPMAMKPWQMFCKDGLRAPEVGPIS
jgi:hypothetical protein